MLNEKPYLTAVALANSLEKMTVAIEAAIITYEATSTYRANTAYVEWKEKALSILKAHLETLRRSTKNITGVNDLPQVLAIADSDVHLSKNLDGFHFDFAGPVHEQALRDAVREVVFAASDLLDAVG